MKSLDNQFFFSVVQLDADINLVLLPYLTDNHQLIPDINKKRCLYMGNLGYLSKHDVYRPPILSGLVYGQPSVVNIAKQYCMDGLIIFNNNHHANQLLLEFSKYNSGIISYAKKGIDKYDLAIWTNRLHYLCNIEPIFERRNLTENELHTLLIEKQGFSEQNYLSGYVINYIRKKEAIKRFKTKPQKSDIFIIEFIYKVRNKNHYEKQTWYRHRIIKKTKSNIFVELFPYCGCSYLKQGWQSQISYAFMVKRDDFEKNGYAAYSNGYMLYSKSEFEKIKHTIKDDDAKFNAKLDDDIYDVVEIPINNIQWAMDILGITKWPETIEAIKKAFVKASLKHHPDRGGIADMFIKSKAARDVLLDALS
ncbi:J domain-containing protein [Methylocucumis oryzae]|uniref:J domain-containing protein n=1 Tax=Methylocucumis oryzae TaxID=1632867 RepID=A0A0F3IR49_9GAMM|nr:J domain-containing protein [Methylocucumis oryzae]KJV08059.1 hypothetical protein VZ94_00415 [Methylocucumis oryzae]